MEEFKARRFAKSRLLSHSLVSRVIATCRAFVSTFQGCGALPEVFYWILVANTILNISCPCLMPLSDDLWPTDSKLRNIVKFASICWRIGVPSYSGASYYVMLIPILINIFIGGIIYAFSLYFAKKLYLSKRIAIIIMFFTDFLLPLSTTILPTSAGSIIALVITNADAKSSALPYAFLFLTFFTYLVAAGYLYLFIYVSQVKYSKGRSNYWAGKAQTIITIIASVYSMISRIAELTTKSTRIVCLALILVIAIIADFAGDTILPLIELRLNGIFSGIIFGSIIVIVMIFAIISGARFSMEISVLIFIAVGFIATVVVDFLMAKTEAKSIQTLDIISEDHSKIDLILKSTTSFDKIARTGFKYGHSYILSWEPFREAIRKWPRSEGIQNQFIRFLAIYHSENSKLIEQQKAYKDIFGHSLIGKIFVGNVIKLIESRDRRLNSTAKARLQKITEQTRLMKMELIAFWKAADNKSANEAFIRAKKSRAIAEDIDSRYNDLMTLYPNKPAVYTHYADYCTAVLCNPGEGQRLRLDAEKFQTDEKFFIDDSQDSGLDLFPFLPNTLHENIIEKTVTADTDSNSKSVVDISMPGDFDKDQSQIYNLAQNVQLPHVTKLVLAIFCSFTVTYLIGISIPSLVTYFSFNISTDYYSGLKSLGSLATSISLAEDSIILEALRLRGYFPSPSVVSQSLNTSLSSASNWNSLISSEIEAFDKSATEVSSMLGSTITYSSQCGEYLHSLSTNIIIVDNYSTGFTQHIINSTFLGAINTFGGYLHYFSSNSTDFIASDWLSTVIVNANSLLTDIDNASEKLISEMASSITTSDIGIIVGIIGCLILTAIDGTIAYVAIASYYKNWIFFINSIQSVSRITVKNTIQKLSSSLSKGDDDSGEKNKEMLIELESVSDNDGEHTTRLRYIVGSIIALASVLAVISYFIDSSYEKSINQTMAKAFVDSKVVSSTADLIGKLLLSVAENNSVAIWGMNGSELLDETKTALTTATEALNEFYAVKKSANWAGYLSEDTTSLFTSISEISGFNLSQFVRLEISYDQTVDASSSALASLNLSSSTKSLLTAVGSFNLDLLPNFFNPLIEANEGLMETIVYTMMVSSILIPVVSILLSFTIGSYQYQYILESAGANRFAIECLSMLNPASVLQSPSLMGILSGQYKDAEERILYEEAFNEAINQISEAVVVVDENMYVESFNKKAVESGIGIEQYKGASIYTFAEFEEKKVIESIAHAYSAKTSSNFLGKWNTKLKIITNGVERNVIAQSLVTVGNVGKMKGVIMVSEAKNKTEEKGLKEEVDKIEELRKIAIPKRLRDFFDFGKGIYRVTSSNVVVGAIHIKSGNRKAAIEAAKTCIDQTVDGVITIVYGSSLLFIANAKEHKTNVKTLYTDAIELVRKIAQKADGAKISASLGLSRHIVFGIFDREFGDFHVWSHGLDLAYHAAFLASAGVILVPKDVYEQLSADEVSKVKIVRLQHPLFRDRDEYQLNLLDN